MDFNYQTISDLLINWSLEHGWRILLVVVIAYVAHRVSHKLIERGIRRVIVRGSGTQEAEEKRENTLIQVAHGAVVILVWLVAALTILSEMGVAIAPLLGAAGVAGIALGFGGQYLIKDIITGLFIILENQYRVGDVVCFDSTCGVVEKITLRKSTLRDLDGTVHHVPHGEITKVANLSKDFSRVNINIGISYSSDLEHVIEVVNRVGTDLAEDAAWKDMIVSPPAFLRVDEFADSSINIKILGDTMPLKQWDVSGELRKRLKIAFDKEGIEIPFPQRVLHYADGASKKDKDTA